MTQLKEWKLACPPNFIDLVFPNDDGNPIDKNNLMRRRFEPRLRKACLERIRFHDLRHTYTGFFDSRHGTKKSNLLLRLLKNPKKCNFEAYDGLQLFDFTECDFFKNVVDELFRQSRYYVGIPIFSRIVIVIKPQSTSPRVQHTIINLLAAQIPAS